MGNTEAVARRLQALTGADLFQLEPMRPYSDDYNECIQQAQDDQRRDARPALRACPETLDPYDTIYLGYPNYWGTMPMCVFTFLERFDFTGKTILPLLHPRGRLAWATARRISAACATGPRWGKALPSTAPPCAGRSGPWRPGSKEETNMDLNTLKENSLFPVGEENTAFAAYFDGTSYLNMLTTQQVPIGNVTFEPGCRNHWHIHKATQGGGQILLVTAGRGYYQEWGKPAQELHPGDVVNIPPT